MGRNQLSSDRAAGRRWASVEEIGRALEEAWQWTDAPPLDDFLPPATHPLRRAAMVRLAAMDLDRQWRSARPVHLESYLDSWPELRGDDAAIAELLTAECLSRGIYASLPNEEELQSRFPEHAARLDLAALERQAISARRDRSYLGSERFFLLRQVGKGGMGVVYAAFDRQRNEVLALKALPEARPESLYYFKQEFRNLSEVVHPHLAAPYELLSIGGQWFFTMELLDGLGFIAYVRGQPMRPSPKSQESLYATQPIDAADTGAFTFALADDAPFDRPAVSFERLRELLRQMADALDALHRRGILHRDLKPSNVMVRPNGSLVVLDFGLSTHLASQGETEALPAAAGSGSSSGSTHASTERKLAGTVPYMSPEQTIGLPLTEVSDWYAVGVMLFLAVTGRLPFTGEPMEIADQKRLCLPPDPRDFNADIPDDLHEICLGLLEREARDRWDSEKVRARLGAAMAQPEADATRPAAPVPFVGREGQLAALHDAYQEMAAGASVCVHVCGPSGSGKSRLVSHFLRSSPPAGAAVILTGRCYESESAPYKGLDTIIDSLCRLLLSLPYEESDELLPPDIEALARMFPVLARVDAIAGAVRAARGSAADAQQLRRRAFGALRELLHRLARRRPLILAIDDLQWGDVDSAAVLAELFRPPDVPRHMLLAAYRSEHRGESACLDLLATLGQGGPDASGPACEATAPDEQSLRSAAPAATLRRDVPVGPLSPEESRQMALRLLEEADFGESCAEAIARQAQGSPYFILEMAEHARSGVDLSAASAALDLDAALQGRLERLAATTRRLLEIVAVAGQPLPLRTAFEAAELASASSTHVAELRGQHLLRTHGPGLDDPVSAYHDRIRESVVAHLAPVALTGHHARLAHALERSKRADAEQIARHFDAAGEREQAGRYYGEAADEAAGKLAFDRAARLYERCLDLLKLEEPQRRVLLTRHADALANAGRGWQSAHRYLAAAEGAPGADQFELRRRAAYQFCISGHIDEGRRALAELLRAVGMSLPRTPSRSLAALLANRCRLFLRGTSFTLRPPDQVDQDAVHRIDVIWTASAGLSMFDVVAGADFQTRGCLLALKTGEPLRLARALAWEAAHLSNLGGQTWRRNQRLLSEARQLAQSVPQPYARHWAMLCGGLINFTNGRWRIARSELEQSEQGLRTECTGVAWELNTAHAFTLWSLFYLGEYAEMRQRALRLDAEARERGDLYAAATHGAFCLPIHHLLRDDPEAARGAMTQALSQWTRAGFHVQHFIALMAQTYIDLYCGQGEAAWRRMQEQTPLAARSQMLRVQVMRSLLTHLRGRAALAHARESASPDRLLRAARREGERLLREKMPYCTPHGQHLLAGVAILRGDCLGATRLLEQAATGYEAVEMSALAAAVRCRLGELRGGDDGQRMIDEAHAYFRRQGAANPERMIDALAVSCSL